MSPSPTHQRGAAVEARVLGSTIALLAEHGYEFTVDQVALASRVHKTTVYRRWPTKPALVAAAMDHLADRHVPRPDTGDPVADLTALAVLVSRALAQPAGVNALRAAFGAAGADASLAEAAGRFLRARYQVAIPMIRSAQEQGMLRRDVDPELLWQAIVNPLHLNAVTGGPIDEATTLALVDLALRGARA